MESMLQDLRHALRSLRRSRGFTAAAVAILALGIGANTAIFSLVDAVLLRPLPFHDPERLVWIWSTRVDRDKAFFSIPNFLDTREQSRTLESLAALANWGANLQGDGEPERVQGIQLTPGALPMLGVEAEAGRTLLPEDGEAGSPRVAMLGHGLWQRRFGADRAIVGKSLQLNGESYAVVGVLPAGFTIPGSETDLVVPLALQTDPRREERGSNFLRVFGRLAAGVSPRQAQEDHGAFDDDGQVDHEAASAAFT